MKRFSDVKGFTLVELIVVIAIIAILAAVSIVGFQSYIDRSRFSNDTQTASNMTNILQNHLILNSEDDLHAHEVRTILEQYSDEFDFTPESSNAGFFYLSDSESIVAAKYEDIEDLDTELFIEGTQLLSNRSLDVDPATINSPEELFGNGKILLTTEGSVVAYTVYALRHLSLSGNLSEDFDTLEDYVDSPGFLVNNDHKTLLQALLVEFHPSQTLFVSNSNWATTSSDNVERIIFAPGISNIPTFDDGTKLTLTDSEISLPSTVKTVEKDAFKDLNNNLVVNLPSNVKVHEEAFLSTQTTPSSYQTIDMSDLIDFSEYITITLDGTGTHYDFSGLPEDVRASITGYRATSTSRVHQINVYSSEGLIGTATKAVETYEVIYYYNVKLGDTNVLLSYETTSATFLDPSSIFSGYNIDAYEYAPSGKTFSSWNTVYDGSGTTLTDGDSLPEGNIIEVYAIWS